MTMCLPALPKAALIFRGGFFAGEKGGEKEMSRFSKFTAGLMTAGVMAGLLVTPAFAETTVVISGNGAGSVNKVSVESKCVTEVKQSNTMSAKTEVEAKSDTGGNQASGNTGGTTSVNTSDATTTVAVVVTGGSNEAVVPLCCECGSGPVSATIEDNGKQSKNTVTSSNSNVRKARQGTSTEALTGVSAKSLTGRNKAKWNTGSGTMVGTGASTTEVLVTVHGGSNTLNP